MRLTRQEFYRLVRRAFQELPLGIQDALENVAVLVEDWPGPDDMAEAGSDAEYRIFGLYRGTPLPERDGWLPSLPDTIVIFQRSIESICDSREEVVREIGITLRHEVGHYLGLSEEDLERLGHG